MVGTKRLLFVVIAVSVIGIGAGVLLAGDFSQTKAAQQLGQYAEKTTTSKVVRTVVHSHDGLPEHKHVVTIVTTTTETTPHGGFHDFAAMPNAVQASVLSPAAAPAATPTPAAATPAKGTNEIFIESREFKPSSLTVPVGTKVTWTNKDFEGHVVVSDNGTFGGSPGPGGGTFSHTFSVAGTFTYHCDTHPYMTGTITVTGSPATGANVTTNVTAPNVNLGRHQSE